MEILVLSQYLFVPSIILITLLILKIVALLINNQYKSSKKNLPPSPPKLPIIGNLHQLIFCYHSLKSLAKKYGPMVQIQMGIRKGLIISSVEAAEEVLRKHDLSFAERPRLNFVKIFGYGFRDMVFVPYGEHWRQIRGICVSQLLSNKRVQSFRRVREEEIAKTLDAIKGSCSSSISPISDMSEIFANLCYNVLFRSAIGKSCFEDKNGRWFKALLEKGAKLAPFALIGDFIPWLGWISHIIGVEGKINRIFKEVDGYLEGIIEEATKRSQECDDHSQDDCKSFVDMLLQCQHSGATGFTLHRDSIKALIVDMIFGGTDTTYSLLEWTFAEIMRNPEVMSKLQKEVRDSGGPDGMITEDDLGKLPYLKAVIRESLRMHPPLEILIRAPREAVKIQTYDVAPDTMVFIDIGIIGRDPETWQDPNEFRPERFLVENLGKHFHYLVMAFGSGRRRCPGSGAALVLVELAIANLIRNFSFTLPNGAKPEELDMTVTYGLTSSRKTPLLLVPSYS